MSPHRWLPLPRPCGCRGQRARSPYGSGGTAAARRAVWVLTAGFLCWAVGGHPESPALGALFAGLWLPARFLLRAVRRPGRIFARVALSTAIAVGLSAFLLMPQALAIRDSNR